jgi:hypothetical protein
MPSYTTYSVSRPILSFSTHLLWLALAIIITSNTVLHADDYTTAHDFSGRSNLANPFGINLHDLSDFCNENYPPLSEEASTWLKDIRKDLKNLEPIINHTPGDNLRLSEADAADLLARLGPKSRTLATNDRREWLKNLEIAVTPDGEPSVRYRFYSASFSLGDSSVSGEASCSTRATELGVYAEAHVNIEFGGYWSWYASALTKFNEQGPQSQTENGISFKIGKAIGDALDF